MTYFLKHSFYLPVLVVLTAAQPSHAEVHNHLKAEDFSDHEQLANVREDFLQQAIKYDDKVAADVDVVISLDQQTYPALHEVVGEIASSKGIKVAIQQGTCGVTAKKLLNKQVDIGTFCCPPGATDRLPGLKFHTVALSPIAIFTHKDNPIENVATEDAKKIYRGEYVTWSEVPGFTNLSAQLKGERIQPVVRLHCEKRPGHWRTLMNSADDVSPRAQSVGTIPDMISEVSGNISAIGYETPYMLKMHKDRGALKILNIDEINPDDTAKLISNEYPIYRAFSMTTWTNANNRNEKAGILLDALYEHIQKHGEKYQMVPASKLVAAGWKFKDRELIAEPDGQAVISEH
jgi:phosphate transport system substrate-binding protein